jgi:preprotein translocase subunit SecE
MRVPMKTAIYVIVAMVVLAAIVILGFDWLVENIVADFSVF